MATRLYLTNSAPSFTPSTVRTTSVDSSAAMVDIAMLPTKTGANAAVAQAETSATNNQRHVLIRAVSEPIYASGNSGGNMQLMIARQESAAGMNAQSLLTVYATVGDSDTVRGTLYATAVNTTEWPTTLTGGTYTVALSTVALTAGDRIVVEFGYNAANTSGTSFTGTLRYGGTVAADLTAATTGVTTRSPWVEFDGMDALLFPPTSALTDDFTTDQKATKWPGWYGGTVDISGGVCTLTPGGSTSYAGLASALSPAVSHSLTGSYACIKSTPSAGAGLYTTFTVTGPTAGGVDLTFFWQAGTVNMGQRNNWNMTDSGTSFSQPAGTTCWYAIAEGAGADNFGITGSAGTTYFFSSTDGTTWTQRHSLATPSIASAVRIETEAGESAAGSLEVDDFNILASGGSPVTASPSAIGSGETFGAVVAALVLVASPGGIGSAEAFGTPTETGTLTASPTGISSAQAFGTPSAVKTLTASPGGISTGETFGTPAVDYMYRVTPAGISTAEAFGNPANLGTLTASPAGIISAQAFGTPTAVKTYTASPTGIPSAEAFGMPTETATLTATPAGIASAEAFGTPLVDAGLAARPTGIPSAEALGTPSAMVPLTASPGGIGTAEAFGTPSITVGFIVTPTGIGSAEAFGTPTETGLLTATPTGIGTAELVSNPTAMKTYTATPTGIPSAQALGTPGTTNRLTVQVPSVQAGETFGTPSVTNVMTGRPTGIPSAQALGFPVVSHVMVVRPDAIGSLEAFGTPSVTIGVDMSRDLALLLEPLPDTLITAGLPERFAPADLERRFKAEFLAESLAAAADTGRWSLALIEGEEMHVEILASAGASQYVGGTITETTGKDISAATIKMALGSETTPGAWDDPSVDDPGPTNNVRKVLLLVGAAPNTPKGVYYAWARVTDTPEIVPMRFPQKIIVR